MKYYIATILLILIGQWTPLDTFIVGFAEPESTSIVGQWVNGEMEKCEVFTGETNDCTEAERLFIETKYQETYYEREDILYN